MRKKYVNSGSNKKLSKSNARSKTLIIVGILVAVSIAGSIGAYSAMSGNGSREEEDDDDVGKGLVLLLILRSLALGMISMGLDYFHQENLVHYI